MRTAAAIIITSIAIIFSACSGSDDGDPILDECTKSCLVDKTSPCFSFKNECISKCKGYANKYKTDPKYVEGCGLCIAKQFKLEAKTAAPCDKGSTASSCCYGVIGLSVTAEGPECTTSCFEPDGGAAF